jgi:glycosyltransferase involved in cell wall biosynthesis
VAELRDGWYRWNAAIFPDYPVWRDRLERRLESAAVRTADRVVLVTERMAQAFRHQYAELPADHFAVVSNGFDPSQLAAHDAPARDGACGWHVLHAGAVYYGRSLAAFLEAVRRVAATDAGFAREFHLTLLGTVDASAQREIERAGLDRRIRLLGQVEHRAAVAAMRGADALLLVANTTPGAEATVPGKLFEYLAVGRPVFAVAPAQSSTADVLAQTGGGWLAPAGNAEAIARELRRAYAERALPADRDAIGRFDRRALAGELAGILDRVVMDAARRS